MLAAMTAALALGAVMTIGDLAWAAFHIRHSVAKGIVHGAAMCLCLGLAIGIRARRPAPAAVAGPLVGVIAAASFYALAPSLGWGALFPAWMLLWILFAVLQQCLDRRETLAQALARGVAAALLSGAAFYLVSDMWVHESAPIGVARRYLSWSFAFLPGFLALFWSRPRRASAGG
jgi:hypothetical protein